MTVLTDFVTVIVTKVKRIIILTMNTRNFEFKIYHQMNVGRIKVYHIGIFSFYIPETICVLYYMNLYYVGSFIIAICFD